MKTKISVCIICRDEEKVIENCLKSLSWADEIVIVDSGSTDSTLEIAEKYTDKIFYNEWPGFGPQRQKAESLASHDWVFAIDCDEVVPTPLQKEIVSHFSQNRIESNRVFRVNRLTEFCGRFIRHSGWYPDRIARIYNRKHTGYDDLLVHEKVKTENCELINLKSDLHHFNRDSWDKYRQTLSRYAEDSAQQKFDRGQRSHFVEAYARALFAFCRHYFLKLGFLDGKPGLLIAYAQVKYTYDKYSLLIKKTKTNPSF